MVPRAVVSLSAVGTSALQNVGSKGESLRADEEGGWWECSREKHGEAHGSGWGPAEGQPQLCLSKVMATLLVVRHRHRKRV